MKSFFFVFILFCLANIGLAQVVVYPAPATNFAKVSDKYVVAVTQNGVTHNSFVYKSTAGSGPTTEWGLEVNNRFHFTTYSFSGNTTVTVTKLNSTATSATIRPNRQGLGTKTTTVSGTSRSITFPINTYSTKISVEFSDDPSYADALMIFADPLETPSLVPSTTASNVMLVSSTATASSLATIPSGKTIVYFAPGVYSLGGRWTIPSTVKQVYIAGGAYIKGYLYRNVQGTQATNTITINGRGIISGEGFTFHYPSTATDQNSNNWYYAIGLSGGQNCLIEGVTLMDATAFNIYEVATANTTIKNVKIAGFRYNNDGIDISGSGYVITNCFIRVNDDQIIPYASNITISNCTFWHLHSGSIIQLGWTPHNLANISITNCDVLHDETLYTDSNVGFISAQNSSPTNNAADINNITISNIYFSTPILRFVDIRGDRKGVSTKYPNPWVYRNFNISNIYFAQSPVNAYPLIYMHGYDVNHPLVSFVYKGLYFNNVMAIPSSVLAPVCTSQLNIKPLTIQ